MIDIEKTYAVYQLEITPRTKEYSPSLEEQLKRIAKRFEDKYGELPQEMFVGPFEKNGQTFIRTGEVYVPLSELAKAKAESLEGYQFTTGYETIDPSSKTHGG